MRRINRYVPLGIQNFFYEQKADEINIRELEKWKADGSPIPPPHLVKQEIIEKYARKYSCDVLIETGTYLGDTVFSQRNNFSQIISVELGRRFFSAAKKRFRRFPHITILHGNSGDLMIEIMQGIKSRSLLWLDGHYSGGITAKGETESPVYRELDAAFSNNELKHVILIDDARLFIGKRDYPTLEELTSYIRIKDPEYKVETETDIIIISP